MAAADMNSWQRFVAEGVIECGHPDHSGRDKYCICCKAWATSEHLASDKHAHGFASWADKSWYSDYNRIARGLNYLNWADARETLKQCCANASPQLLEEYMQAEQADLKYRAIWRLPLKAGRSPDSQPLAAAPIPGPPAGTPADSRWQPLSSARSSATSPTDGAVYVGLSAGLETRVMELEESMRTLMSRVTDLETRTQNHEDASSSSSLARWNPVERIEPSVESTVDSFEP